ncbi:MAG: sulfotransferase family 2 domain-containing protein [Halioglobus sp.]
MSTADALPKILFLHIAKTAGTSLVEHFRTLLPEDAIASHGDFLQYPRDKPLPAHEMEQKKFVSGHFGYRHITPYLDGAFSITFLRDPVARALSFYKFCMHPGMQKSFAVARAAQSLGLDGYAQSLLPEVAGMLDNQQTWQLASMYWEEDRRAMKSVSDEDLLNLAKEHLLRFSYVGLTETFPKDFSVIMNRLGLAMPTTVPQHYVTAKPVAREDVSAATLKLLANRQQLDQQLIEWVGQNRALLGA